MKNLKKLLQFVVGLYIISMLSSCTLTRSASPEDANRVIEKAAQFKQNSVKTLGPSAQMRKPLRSGQWVATLSRSKSDPNEVTLQVMKVVDVKGSTVTLEMEQYASQNSGKRMVIQQTVSNYPVSARTAYSGKEVTNVLKDIKIDSVRIMDDKGEVTTVPQLPFGIGGAANELLNSTVAIADIRTESCSNQSFKSSKCLLVPFQTKVFWMSDKGTTYAHSDIPLLGFIRSESSKYDMETIGFGDKGAKILIKQQS